MPKLGFIVDEILGPDRNRRFGPQRKCNDANVVFRLWFSEKRMMFFCLRMSRHSKRFYKNQWSLGWHGESDTRMSVRLVCSVSGKSMYCKPTAACFVLVKGKLHS